MNKHARDCRSLCEKKRAQVFAFEQRGKRTAVVCTAGTLIVPRSTNDYRWQKNAMAQARRIARQNQLRLLRVGHDPLQ